VKRRILIVLALGVLACAAAVWAGFVVQPDKENVVASRLAGRWGLEGDLTKRLTGQMPSRTALGMGFEFVPDAAVAAKVPAKYAKFLKDKPIYLAGHMWRYRMSVREKKFPFILISHRGNPHVVYFRERGGDPMGDAESFNVMLAVAKDKGKDLLFVGGDFNNQPFSAYHRGPERD